MLEQYDPLLQTERLADHDVIRVVGEIDLASAPRLCEVIGETPVSTALVVDLSACAYVDSSVLTVLIQASKARPGKLTIVIPEDARIRKIFQVTKLDQALDIRPRLEHIE